jgi:hypothetical protein
MLIPAAAEAIPWVPALIGVLASIPAIRQIIAVRAKRAQIESLKAMAKADGAAHSADALADISSGRRS